MALQGMNIMYAHTGAEHVQAQVWTKLLGDNATADVLADLSSQSGSIELDVSIARYCVAVKVACSYAMLCHVTKVSRPSTGAHAADRCSASLCLGV